MIYAKSNPQETLKEHTDELVNQIKYLRKVSSNQVEKITNLGDKEFWKLLELACKYHDIGKIFTPFQNLILKQTKQKRYQQNLIIMTLNMSNFHQHLFR